MKNKIFNKVKLLFLFIIIINLTGCIKTKVEISLNEDGSGICNVYLDITKHLGISKEFIETQIRQEFLKGGDKETEISYLGEDNEYYKFIIKKRFKNISELNDKGLRFSFNKKDSNFVKRKYILNITAESSKTGFDFPVVFSVKLPGKIVQHEGIAITDNNIVSFTLPDNFKATVIAESYSPVFYLLVVLIIVSILIISFILVYKNIVKRKTIQKEN